MQIYRNKQRYSNFYSNMQNKILTIDPIHYETNTFLNKIILDKF